MKKIIMFSMVVLLVFAVMPASAQQVFPPAGQDYYSSTRMTFQIEMLPNPGVWMPGVLDGPINVGRSDPYPYALLGGDEAIDTEMLMMNMVGQIGGMPAELDESTSLVSPGMIVDTNPDPADSFPAFSFFDIFFEVTVYGTPWGTITLHNNDPLRMESTIDKIPPDLALNQYTSPGWIPIGEWTPYEIFPTLQGFPLPLYDPLDVHIANLDTGSACHSPEPATVCLLGFGGLALLRKRRFR